MSKQGTTSENDTKAEIIAALLTRQGLTKNEKREQIEKLLKEGANVHHKFTYVGESLLHLACGLGAGDLEIVKLLVEYGANPNTKDDLGRTPLHLAGMNDYGNVFDYLTNLDPTKKNTIGTNYIKADKTIAYNYAGKFRTPEDSLQGAREHKETYKEEIKEHQEHKELILKRKAREAIDKKDLEEFVAVLNDLQSLNLLDTLDAIDYFDPAITSPLLHNAAASGQVEMVNELIRRGADVNYADLEHTFPLHHAIKEKNIDVIKALLAAGADPLKSPGKKGLPSPMELAEKFIKDDIIVNILKNTAQEKKIKSEETIPSAIPDAELVQVPNKNIPSEQVPIKLELEEVKKLKSQADIFNVLVQIETDYPTIKDEMEKIKRRNGNAAPHKKRLNEMKSIIGYLSASNDVEVKKVACEFADKVGIPRRHDTITGQLISRFRDPTTLISTLNPTYSVEEIKKLVAGAFFDEKAGFQVGVIRSINEAYNTNMPVSKKLAFVKNAMLLLQTAIELDANGSMFPLLSGNGALQQEYQNLLTKIKEDAGKSNNASLVNAVKNFEGAINQAIQNNQKNKESLIKHKEELLAQKISKTDIQSYINLDLQRNDSRTQLDSMAKQMADDLYTLASVRMMSIDVSDLMGKKWEKESHSTISEISEEFNKLAAKVTNEILNAKTKEHQINITLLYSKVFQYAIESGNYHIANAIGSGLNHNAINKISYLTDLPALKKVYAEQSSKDGVLNGAGKYEMLRIRMDEDVKSGKAPIPIIALYLGEIVTTAESDPLVIDDPANSSKQIKNPIRMEKTGKTINTISHFQTLLKKKSQQQPKSFSTNILKGIASQEALVGEKDSIATIYGFSWCPRPLTIKADTTLSQLNKLTAEMLRNYAQTEIAPAFMKVTKGDVVLEQEKAYLAMLEIINRDPSTASIQDQFAASKLLSLINSAVVENNLTQGKLRKELEKAKTLLSAKEADLNQIKDIDNAIYEYKNYKNQGKRTAQDEARMNSLYEKISKYQGPMKTELLKNFNSFNEGVTTLNQRVAKLAELKQEFEIIKNEVPINFQKLFQLNFEALENEKMINYAKREGKFAVDNKSEGDYFLGVFARTLSIDKEFTIELDAVFNKALKSYQGSIDNISTADAQAMIALNQKFQKMTNENFPEVNTGYKKFHNENISLLFSIVKKLDKKNEKSNEQAKADEIPKAPTNPPSAIPVAPSLVATDATLQEVKVQGAEQKPASKEATVAKSAENGGIQAPSVGQLVPAFYGKIFENKFSKPTDAELKDAIIEAAKIYAAFTQVNKGQIKPLNELITSTKADEKELRENALLFVKALEIFTLTTPASAEELKHMMEVLKEVQIDAANQVMAKELDSIKTLLSAKMESLIAKMSDAEPAKVLQQYVDLKGRYQGAATQAEKQKVKEELDAYENKLRKLASTKNTHLRAQVISLMSENGILGKPESSFVKQLLSGYKDPTNFKFDLEDTSPKSSKFSQEELKTYAAAFLSVTKSEAVLAELTALIEDQHIGDEQKIEIINNASQLLSAMMQSSIHSDIFKEFNPTLLQFMQVNANTAGALKDELNKFKDKCEKSLQVLNKESQNRDGIIARFQKNEPNISHVDQVLNSQVEKAPKKRAQKKEAKDTLDKMAEQLADDFYKRGMAHVLNIKPTDLYNLAWSKPKTASSTNVVNFIGEFNVISNMVQMDILNKPTVSQQEELARFYLKVADYSYQKGDFNTLMAIASAFNNANLYNLAHIKAMPERDEFFKRQEIINIIDRSKNYAKHREAVKIEQSKGKTIIPYVGIYLTDLTFIEEGNPSSRKDPYDANRALQMNADKLEWVGAIYQVFDKTKEAFASKAVTMDGLHTDLQAKLALAQTYTEKQVMDASENYRASSRNIISLDAKDTKEMMEHLREKNPKATITRIFECTSKGKMLVGEEALNMFLTKLLSMETAFNTLDKEYLQNLAQSINTWINDKDNQKLCSPKEVEQLKAKSAELSKKIEFNQIDSTMLPKLITIREMALSYLSTSTNRTKVSVALDKIIKDYEKDKSVENQLYFREAQSALEIIEKLEYFDAAIDRVNQNMNDASLLDKVFFAAENKMVEQNANSPIAMLADLAKEIIIYDHAGIDHMKSFMQDKMHEMPDLTLGTLSDAEVISTYQKLVNKLTTRQLAQDVTGNIEEHPLIKIYTQKTQAMQGEDVTLEKYLELEMELKKIKLGLETLTTEPDLEKALKAKLDTIKNKIAAIENKEKAKLEVQAAKLKENKRKEYAQLSKEEHAKNKDAIEVTIVDSPLTTIDKKLIEVLDSLDSNLDEYRSIMLKINQNPSAYFDTGNRLEVLDQQIRHALDLMNSLKYGVNLELANFPELKSAWHEMHPGRDPESLDMQRIISVTINDKVKLHSVQIRKDIESKLAQYKTLEHSRNIVSPRKMAKAARDLKADRAQLLKFENKKHIERLGIPEKLPDMPDFNSMIADFCQHFNIQTITKKDDRGEDRQIQPTASIPATVFKELLDTEKSYINSMFLLDRVLIGEMLDKYDSLEPSQIRGFSTKMEFVDLVIHHIKIREAQQQFLNNLQNPDPAAWFANIDTLSKLYVNFVQNFSKLQLPPDVAEVIKTGTKKQTQSFAAVWILPVQRLPRYVLLLQTLSKEMAAQYTKQYGEAFSKALQGNIVPDSEPNKEAILSALSLHKQLLEQLAKVQAATSTLNTEKDISLAKEQLLQKLNVCHANPNKQNCQSLMDEIKSSTLASSDIIHILSSANFNEFKVALAQIFSTQANAMLALNSNDPVAAYIKNKVVNDKMRAYLQSSIEKASKKSKDNSEYKAILAETMKQVMAMVQTPPYAIDLNNLRTIVKNNLQDADAKKDFEKIIDDEGLFKKLQKIHAKFSSAVEEKVVQELKDPEKVEEAKVLEQVQVAPQQIPVQQAPQIDSALLISQLDEIANVRDHLFSLFLNKADKAEIAPVVAQHKQLKDQIEKSLALQANLFKFREMVGMDISNYNFLIRNNIHRFSNRSNYESTEIANAIVRYRARLHGYSQDNSIAPELRQRFAKDLQALDQVLKAQIEEAKDAILTHVETKDALALKSLVIEVAPQILQKPQVAPLQEPLPVQQPSVLPPRPTRPAPQAQSVLIQREIGVANAAVANKLKRYIVAATTTQENMQKPMTDSFLLNILNIRNRLVVHKMHNNPDVRNAAATELNNLDKTLNDFISKNQNKPLAQSLMKVVPSPEMQLRPEDLPNPEIQKLIDIRNSIFELRMVNESDNIVKDEIAQEINNLEQEHKLLKKVAETAFPAMKDLMVLRELIAIDKHDPNYKVNSAINKFTEQDMDKNMAGLKVIARHRERLFVLSQQAMLAPELREIAAKELEEVNRMLLAKLEQSKDAIKEYLSDAKGENVSVLMDMIDNLAPDLLLDEPTVLSEPSEQQPKSSQKVGVLLLDEVNLKPNWKRVTKPSWGESPSTEAFITVSNPQRNEADRRKSITIDMSRRKEHEELLTQNSNSLNVLPKFFQVAGGEQGELDKEKMKSYGIENIIPRKIVGNEQELTIKMSVEKEPGSTRQTPTVDISARAGVNGGVVYSLKSANVTPEQKNKALENFCKAYVLAAEPGTTFTLPPHASPERNELVKGYLLQALKERCEKEGIPFKPDVLAVPNKATQAHEDKRKSSPR